jgi:hypothetical protein
LRLRGVEAASKAPLVESLEVEDAGLSGIVALMKMRESALRCRVFGVDCCDWLANVSEDEDGVNGSCVENDVRSGSSIWRFARGDCGRPMGVEYIEEDILCDLRRTRSSWEMVESRSISIDAMF